MQTILLYLAALGAGISVAVQQVLNGNLRVSLNSPAWAGFFSYLGGLLTMILVLLAMREQLPSWKLVTATQWWAWSGGVLGGIFILLVILLLIAASGLSPSLRQLELGDDAAKATGTRTEPVRLTVMLIAVALTAVVTAAAGPIAFVALAAPQIARRIARTPGVTLAPAACMGALILVAADVVAQHLLPTVLPVGVVTVVVGGTYLVWLIIREVRNRA